MDPAGAGGNETLVDDDDDDEPAEVAVCAFVARNLSAGSKPGPAARLEEAGEEGPSPYWRPSAVLWRVHTSSPSGLFRVLWEEARLQP